MGIKTAINAPAQWVRSRLGRRLQTSVHNALNSSPYLTGKIRSMAGFGQDFALRPMGDLPDPVPPAQLWEGYAEDAAAYLASGERDVAILIAALAEHLPSGPLTVLDLGCAAGRMLRFFPNPAGAELWGLDISSPHIRWCQQHLPALNFATISTAPHLPFPDEYFDMVYCGSVFTHISDLADAWLLELRRVLKPQGCAYITVHDRVSYELLFTDYAADPLFDTFVAQARVFEAQFHARETRYDVFSFGSDPYSQVFYDRDYIIAKWSKWLDVLAYNPQVHDHQSALVLQKRTRELEPK